MGILYAKGNDGKHHPYVIIGIIEKNNRADSYVSWMKSRGNVIREISNKAYTYIAKSYHK